MINCRKVVTIVRVIKTSHTAKKFNTYLSKCSCQQTAPYLKINLRSLWYLHIQPAAADFSSLGSNFHFRKRIPCSDLMNYTWHWVGTHVFYNWPPVLTFRIWLIRPGMALYLEPRTIGLLFPIYHPKQGTALSDRRCHDMYVTWVHRQVIHSIASH